jgi:hypothetical protein
VVFSKNFFVADSNEITVSYCVRCVEIRHREVSGHKPHLSVWEPKIGVFFFFVNFSSTKKARSNFLVSKEAH